MCRFDNEWKGEVNRNPLVFNKIVRDLSDSPIESRRTKKPGLGIPQPGQ